jgi:NAD(P)-dependent dehydrogenase (short-subunit alcohol dehydrogenase family)
MSAERASSSWALPPVDVGSLVGRVAVVTGAGARGDGIGNGRAIALFLARAGARVVAADISLAAANRTAEMGAKVGLESIHPVAADVAFAEQCEAVVAGALDRFGSVDVLVNNVGIRGPEGSAVDVPDEDWDSLMKTNVKSMMLMTKYCVPEMRRRGRGVIVNIASTSGLLGGDNSLAYPTSKGAIISMTRAMAGHHARDSIRVNCVVPGPVFTPMVEAAGVNAELREARRKSVPLMSEGDGWDVAMAVQWLASDAARWVTGVVLPIDGGFTAIRQRERRR